MDNDRFYGCLAGLALGDALGMPTELLTSEEISSAYGWVSDLVLAPPGHPHRRFQPGRVTDDTGQALAIAHAYAMDGSITPESAAESLLAWAAAISPEDFASFTGPSTRQALENLKHGKDVYSSGAAGATNGAAMRVAPVGLVNVGDALGALQDAIAASLPTHNTSPAIAGAAAVACAIAEAARQGSTLISILQAGKEGAVRGARYGGWSWSTPLDGRIELAERLVLMAPDSQQALRDLYRFVGTGFAPAESVAAVFGVVLLAGGDPMQAIFSGANLGGDTDTIAAMAGAICGAWKGMAALDTGLVQRVEAVNGLNLAGEAHRLLQIAAIKGKKCSSDTG